MTREEFCSLPAAMALKLLWDAVGPATRDNLEHTEKPKVPYPPKYDERIYRKAGYQWASETDLEGLRYWRGQYARSAEGGGQYADKDRKRVEKLDRWIAWRECLPAEVWRGTRGNDAVTAAAPSGKPDINSNERREADTGTDQEPADDRIPF